MERPKELTGDDFDPLFDDLSDESANLVLELMRESYNSFNVYIQQRVNSKLEPLKVENKLTNDQHCGTAAHRYADQSNVVGSTVFAYAGCPPPRFASAAAFDDTIISLLGESGTTDEFLWNNLQEINLDSCALRLPAISRIGGTNRIISNTDMDGQSQGTDILDDTKLGTDASSADPHNSALENSMKLVRKYGRSLVEVLHSNAFTATPIVPMQQQQHKLLRTEEACSSASLLELINSIHSAHSNAKLSNDTSNSVISAHADAAPIANASVRLGKRGRYFLDIWDEEEYIARLKGPTRLRPLYQWEDLFQTGYCDNHDGCYRDWLLSHQEAAKARLHDPKYKKNKRRSSDPIFRYDLGVSGVENSELSALAAPPVPVAIQHPASWAVRSTASTSNRNDGSIVRINDLKETIDVSQVHPASVTSTVVQPIHQKQARSARTAASSLSSTILSSGISPLDTEDVDDFNIYADRLLQSLQTQEVTNFARLAQLQSAIRVHSNPQLRALKEKRRKLEDLMGTAVQSMEPTSADRVVYAFKPTKLGPAMAHAAVLGKIHGDEATGRSGEIIRLDIKGNVIPRKLPMEIATNSLSRYNTRCTENSTGGNTAVISKPDAIKLRRDLVGGSSARQVAHGTTLAQCLMPEAEVEVCINRVWQVATVCRVMYDGEHIRHVKVMPQDCTAMESVWMSVEDGKLAPYGTHLRPISIPAVNSSSIGNPTTAQVVTSMPPLPAATSLLDDLRDTELGSTSRTAQSIINNEATLSAASPMVAIVSRETSDAAPVGTEGMARPIVAQGADTWHSEKRTNVPVVVASVLAESGADHVVATGTGSTSMPPPRPPSISRPAPHAVAMPQQLHHYQTLSPPVMASGVDTFKQAPGMLGLVSDPRLRRGPASLQDLHGPSQIHSGMLSVAPGLNIPIHSGSLGYAGNVPMDAQGTMNGSRVKIPLPLGATNKRDLITTVLPFASRSFVPTMIPQPFNPYARHQGVPYEYEYEGAGEVHHRPVFDSMNCQTTNSMDRHGGASAKHGGEEVVHDNGHEFVILPPSSAAAGANATFRLGKKGAITRN